MVVSNKVWLATLVICKQLYEHEEYLISDQIFISYYKLTKSKILDAVWNAMKFYSYRPLKKKDGRDGLTDAMYPSIHCNDSDNDNDDQVLMKWKHEKLTRRRRSLHLPLDSGYSLTIFLFVSFLMVAAVFLVVGNSSMRMNSNSGVGKHVS